MPNQPLVIVGAGGLGREVAALVESVDAESPAWTLTGFVDDDETLHGTSVMGYPVHGNIQWLSRQSNLQYAIGIGDGETRREMASRLESSDVDAATLTHPGVSVHRTVRMGPGCILCEGAAPTVNVTFGAHVIVDQHVTVGHDAVLDSFVSLRPGAHVSGSVHLERGVTLGSGSIVLPDVTVGAGTTVGAGAVVTADLPPDCTAVGVPARPQS